MYSAFASHCRQEYAGAYEILFGVSALDDQRWSPCVSFRRSFRITPSASSSRSCSAPTANLDLSPRPTPPHAQYPDSGHQQYSDIVVSPRYLCTISWRASRHRPCATRSVGMVTAPIAAAPTACHAGSPDLRPAHGGARHLHRLHPRRAYRRRIECLASTSVSVPRLAVSARSAGPHRRSEPRWLDLSRR